MSRAPNDPMWKAATEITREGAVERDLNTRQIAFNLVRDLDGDWGRDTLGLAKDYYDLVYRSGSEADRMKVAQKLAAEFRFEQEAALSKARIAEHHAEAFEAAAKVHQKLIGSEGKVILP